MKQAQERLGLVFAALCALSGSFVPAFARLTTGRGDPLFVAAATGLFAGIGCVVLLAARGELAVLWRDGRAPKLAALGALGTGLTFLLFYAGAARATAIETALALQIEPAYSLLLSWLALGHRPTLRRAAALALILAGIALALGVARVGASAGVAFLVATPLCWQLSHLFVLKKLPGTSPIALTGARYVYGGALLAVVWALRGAALPPAAELAALLPILALQGVVLSMLGTLLWYQTIARLDLGRATAIVVPSIPVLSLGASFLMLGEVAVERVLSSTRSSVAVVQVRFQKGVGDVGKEFDDIKLKLDSIHDLPPGAGPIRFVKDFGDTATLLLTVASPRIGEVEIAMRARSFREALERTRHPGAPGPRVAVVYSFPRSVPPEVVRPHFSMFGRFGADEGAFSDIDLFEGPGFVGLDAVCTWDDRRLLALADRFLRERVKASELHPDTWRGLTIRDPHEIEAKVTKVSGDELTLEFTYLSKLHRDGPAEARPSAQDRVADVHAQSSRRAGEADPPALGQRARQSAAQRDLQFRRARLDRADHPDAGDAV